MKKVVVMLSMFNGELYIAEQIKSIEDQTGVLLTILIRDDGSTDNTLSIVRQLQNKYGNIIVISGDNIGICKSFMTLAVYAKSIQSDFYAFSDQDDVWDNDKLISAIDSAYDKDEKTPYVYFGNLKKVDEELRSIGDVYKRGFKITKKGALVRNYAYGCTMVFNSSALSLFVKNPNVRMWMHDYWLYLIGLFLGEIEYDNRTHIKYRQHDRNAVGVDHSISKIIKIKALALKNIFKHQREEMVTDFNSTFADLINSDDQEIIAGFLKYRQSVGSRIKNAFDIGYWVYNPWQNIFLVLRFLIGNI